MSNTGLWRLPAETTYRKWKLPLVEIFETVEGEGSCAGFPTVFVRTFHCNLRCTWCDTPYSYAPEKPELEATIGEIIEKVASYSSRRVCLTGGEPLLHREKSAALVAALAHLPRICDVHIETNGAVDLAPFAQMRKTDEAVREKVRFIMDYKLPDSGEMKRMNHHNFNVLDERDEIKFVIGNDHDLRVAREVIQKHYRKGQILFSPVWGKMEAAKLVEAMLAEPLPDVRLSLQLHKMIWHPDARGV